MDVSVEKYFELNFDGLVGPTHNYAGLAFGNTASIKSAYQVSHPKLAALQGLKKMHLLMQLGIAQAVLPPQPRPNLAFLRNVGFKGSDIQVLSQAKKHAPGLFYACYSSSSMWAANAATVSPSSDTNDGKLHITPANLISHFHRSLESEITYKVLNHVFKDKTKFTVHSPLPAHPNFGDEGAANHNRLCLKHGDKALEIFVYGRSIFDGRRIHNSSSVKQVDPALFPARQTLEASEAIARRHQLSKEDFLFVKQNPHVIDKGVFHNDVISVINENVILAHELAFDNMDEFYKILQDKASFPIYFLKIKEKELSVKTAVETYLFNSQIVTLPDNSMALIAPIECKENTEAYNITQKILEWDNPIQKIHFVDCRESMLNGGGPACLRLRVVLTEHEKNAIDPGVFLNEEKYQALVAWVNRFYRDEIKSEDLLDPLLIEESQNALQELTTLLNLGSIYDFQKE